MDKVNERVEKSWSSHGPGKKRRIVSPELRMKAVKLYLEEKLPRKLICHELGVHESMLYRWARKNSEQGEDGLKTRRRVRRAAEATNERQVRSDRHSARRLHAGRTTPIAYSYFQASIQPKIARMNAGKGAFCAFSCHFPLSQIRTSAGERPRIREERRKNPGLNKPCFHVTLKHVMCYVILEVEAGLRTVDISITTSQFTANAYSNVAYLKMRVEGCL